MGKFRERMHQDMQVRGYSLNTSKVYLSCVDDFVRYYKRPPDELGLEEVRRFQLHLTSASALTRNEPPLLCKLGPPTHAYLSHYTACSPSLDARNVW